MDLSPVLLLPNNISLIDKSCGNRVIKSRIQLQLIFSSVAIANYLQLMQKKTKNKTKQESSDKVTKKNGYKPSQVAVQRDKSNAKSK